MSDNKCFHCEGTEGVMKRSFQWHYRPRGKDIARGEVGHSNYMLSVSFCDKCYSRVEGESVRGWDWWDAYDCLDYCLSNSDCIDVSVESNTV